MSKLQYIDAQLHQEGLAVPDLPPINALADSDLVGALDATEAKASFFGEQLARTRAALLEEENKRHLFEQTFLREVMRDGAPSASRELLLVGLVDDENYRTLIANCQDLAQRRILIEERYQQLRAYAKRLTQHVARRARVVAPLEPRNLRPIRR